MINKGKLTSAIPTAGQIGIPHNAETEMTGTPDIFRDAGSLYFTATRNTPND